MLDELEQIDKKLDNTEDDEITINLLYQKVDLLQAKANKYDSLVEKIKELKCNLDKDGFVGYADEITDILEELE